MKLRFCVRLACFVAGVSLVAAVDLEMILMVSSAARFNTSGVIPTVDLALQTVNNWSLPFNLSYSTIFHSEASELVSIYCCFREWRAYVWLDLAAVWLWTKLGSLARCFARAFSFTRSCDWVWLFQCYRSSSWNPRTVKFTSSEFCSVITCT